MCVGKRSREGVTEALWQRKREPHGFEMEYVHSKHQSRSALSERENPFGVLDKQTVVKGHVKINCVTWNEIYFISAWSWTLALKNGMSTLAFMKVWSKLSHSLLCIYISLHVIKVAALWRQHFRIRNVHIITFQCFFNLTVLFVVEILVHFMKTHTKPNFSSV